MTRSIGNTNLFMNVIILLSHRFHCAMATTFLLLCKLTFVTHQPKIKDAFCKCNCIKLGLMCPSVDNRLPNEAIFVGTFWVRHMPTKVTILLVILRTRCRVTTHHHTQINTKTQWYGWHGVTWHHLWCHFEVDYDIIRAANVVCNSV